jgi:hypothetical protein
VLAALWAPGSTQAGVLDRRIAALPSFAGVPMALLGATASSVVSGRWLLIARPAVLGVGVDARAGGREPRGRAVRPDRCGHRVGGGGQVRRRLLATGGGIRWCPSS